MNLSHFCLFHRFQPAVLLAKALCARGRFFFAPSVKKVLGTSQTEQKTRSALFFFFPSALLTLCQPQTLIHPLLLFFLSGCMRVSAFFLLLQRQGAAEMPRAVRLAQLYLERNCGNEVVGQHKEVIVIARRCGEGASFFFSFFFLGFFYKRNVRCLLAPSLNGTAY